jgi:TonB family protein
MRQNAIPFIVFCLLSLVVLPAVAQDNNGLNQKEETQSRSTETEQPKSEVELMLEEAKKRGEPIMGTRLEKSGENSDAKTTDGVETGHALKLPQPVYPPLAARAHASGEVQVKVIVDIDGKVIAASAISGHPLLKAAAVIAARSAVFKPMTFEGRPVKVVGVIRYNFVR